jgi:hypothetical protein
LTDFNLRRKIKQEFGPKATSDKPRPTIIRGVPLLPEAVGDRRLAAGAHLLDISGRRVLTLRPGANDVWALAPGVYFVRQASSVMRQAASVTKVVLTE